MGQITGQIDGVKMTKYTQNKLVDRLKRYIDICLQDSRIALADIREDIDELDGRVSGANTTLSELRQLRANVDEQITRYHDRILVLEAKIATMQEAEKQRTKLSAESLADSIAAIAHRMNAPNA